MYLILFLCQLNAEHLINYKGQLLSFYNTYNNKVERYEFGAIFWTDNGTQIQIKHSMGDGETYENIDLAIQTGIVYST